MADFASYEVAVDPGVTDYAVGVAPWPVYDVVTFLAVEQRRRMRGRDTVCLVPTFVFWNVIGAPDFTGAQCPPGNLVCGSNPLTQLADICLVASWTDVGEG